MEQIDAELVLAFLEHLEVERGNGARSRNAGLAAINTFFRFLESRLPDCLDQAGRIHAIPMKKRSCGCSAGSIPPGRKRSRPRAIAIGALTYKSLASILAHNLDRAQRQPETAAVIDHPNLRGSRYFH